MMVTVTKYCQTFTDAFLNIYIMWKCVLVDFRRYMHRGAAGIFCQKGEVLLVLYTLSWAIHALIDNVANKFLSTVCFIIIFSRSNVLLFYYFAYI